MLPWWYIFYLWSFFVPVHQVPIVQERHEYWIPAQQPAAPVVVQQQPVIVPGYCTTIAPGVGVCVN